MFGRYFSLSYFGMLFSAITEDNGGSQTQLRLVFFHFYFKDERQVERGKEKKEKKKKRRENS